MNTNDMRSGSNVDKDNNGMGMVIANEAMHRTDPSDANQLCVAANLAWQDDNILTRMMSSPVPFLMK
ncbi:hypothetical protein ACA910_016116 [Epithemia clementina (nom. ined.)]